MAKGFGETARMVMELIPTVSSLKELREKSKLPRDKLDTVVYNLRRSRAPEARRATAVLMKFQPFSKIEPFKIQKISPSRPVEAKRIIAGNTFRVVARMERVRESRADLLAALKMHPRDLDRCITRIIKNPRLVDMSGRTRKQLEGLFSVLPKPPVSKPKTMPRRKVPR